MRHRALAWLGWGLLFGCAGDGGNSGSAEPGAVSAGAGEQSSQAGEKRRRGGGGTAAEPAGQLSGVLAAHNAARAAVGVEPLVWSEAVERHATKWAKRLKAKGCPLEHSSNNEFGQNLFWSSGETTARQVVSSWTSEEADYDHGANRCKGVCGHYTQVVWAASRRLGCGVAACGEQQVWVCEYDPPGNYVGQRPY